MGQAQKLLLGKKMPEGRLFAVEGKKVGKELFRVGVDILADKAKVGVSFKVRVFDVGKVAF